MVELGEANVGFRVTFAFYTSSIICRGVYEYTLGCLIIPADSRPKVPIIMVH